MTAAPPPDAAGAGAGAGAAESGLAVFRNRPFLLLWLAQAATQVGGNMVLFGLVVIVEESTRSNSAVAALILTFLVPAVLFSAVAGVYVDRLDRRLVLVVTNLLRAVAFVAIYFVGDHLLAILLLNIFVSTVTVFFAPAEASMIPQLVPRRQLISANGIFTLTLNGAFAIGFALLGPLVVRLAGPSALLLLVAVFYLVASAFCWVLPPAPPRLRGAAVTAGRAVADAERAVEATLAQLREGLAFIRQHREISWSLTYLAIAASLVGVLGVLGPNFARTSLGLEAKDFVVIVLPLGAGIVTGILTLNSYGKYLPRRRVIEGGLVALGGLLVLLSIAGPISQIVRQAQAQAGGDLSGVTSLLAVVVAIAFLAGMSYAFVAIPAQTQLQEDLPQDVRGRVFGVLNMLVSVASFLPIIIVAPIADALGTGIVILALAIFIAAAGATSIIRRGPLAPAESVSRADGMVPGAAVDPVGVVTHTDPTLWEHEPLEEPLTAPSPASQPSVGAADLAAADPFGLGPEDPEAIARAQTLELQLLFDEADDDGVREEPPRDGGRPAGPGPGTGDVRPAGPGQEADEPRSARPEPGTTDAERAHPPLDESLADAPTEVHEAVDHPSEGGSDVDRNGRRDRS